MKAELAASAGPEPEHPGKIRVGTASWAIPGRLAPAFSASGSVLQRYASRFGAVEINSSFHRSHKPGTYARWAQSVPDDFRFAVKLPRTITHERRLVDTEALLDAFLQQIRALETKLGPLLVQLPPSLSFEPRTAAAFFDHLRQSFDGALVCEPRHPGWFDAEADDLLSYHRVARAAADPAPVAPAADPAGWTGFAYFRLHGTPRIYYSEYSAAFLAGLTDRLGALSGRDAWCIFDNTTLGAATENALDLDARLSRWGHPPSIWPESWV